jgi:signal transduction histidine kinase
MDDQAEPIASIATMKSRSQQLRRTFSFTRIKIKYSLPLVIGALLTATLVAATWASYKGVQHSAMEIGRARLAQLTNQLATMMQQSIAGSAARTYAVANESALRNFVTAPSASTESSAIESLKPFTETSDVNGVRVEVRDNKGLVLLSIPSKSFKPPDIAEELQKISLENLKLVGSVRVIDGLVVFPLIAAIRDEQGMPIGSLVRWRKPATSPESRKQLEELLGSNLTLYFGNVAGDVWTDLEKVVEKPAGGLEAARQITQYSRAGRPVIALAQPINGTPWFVAVEQSRDAVMAPADRFLNRMLIIGAILLLIGVAAAFAMSASITRPLDSFTEAAIDISHGNYRRKVRLERQDELGTLAIAFNKMVAKLRDANRELEHKVQERTAELETANAKLLLVSQENAIKRTEAEKAKTEAVEALRRTEAQLRQAQKLEAIGRLAGGVSHDFNNLLTAIMGYSELTISRLDETDPLRNNLREIRNASERAASLTRQLLAFSRKQVLQPKVLDLNSIVFDLQKMLGRMIGEDIQLKTNLQRDLGSVKADPGQVEQVLMNLAVNARDAMPRGGKITIETVNVELDESYVHRHMAVVPGPYVMLAVSDTGMGMDAETQEHIFEPFFTTKEPGKGTGLGLSTVYGIVKQSGGNIWVYSEVGKGSTFKIYLPRVDAAAERYAPSKTNADAPTGTETILLVEDSESVRKLAREVLELSGYVVLEAHGAENALEICQRHPGEIDLLLTDVVMEGLSGRAAADLVLTVNPLMRVLFMSGYTDDAVVRHGVLEEGLNFIQKPFTPVALSSKVREVLDSK